MTYITVKQSPMYRQMSLEELLFGVNNKSIIINTSETNTRTYEVERVNQKFFKNINVAKLINILSAYNTMQNELRTADRNSLHYTFYIEKKGKGMPNVFKKIFETQKGYVQNSSLICKGIAERLRPALSNHGQDTHEKVFGEAKTSIIEFLASNGLDTSKIDLDAVISDSYRKIDAPNDTLKVALLTLKDIFENEFHALYHTSAFAYVRHRSTVDSIKRHQANESKWFGKYDVSNFFGSTTLDFVVKMFSMVFPFSEVVKVPEGKKELTTALELAFLNGGLPQGTPISPIITNIMMIPVDYKLANTLRNFNNQQYVYTRYADDFLISSKFNFNPKEVETLIVSTLKSFGAPFSLKSEKTRYGSSSGSNWNLGVMLNKENKITVGHEKKRRFQAMLSSYVRDKQNGVEWEKSDIQTLEGYRNYYKMIEGDTIDKIVEHVGHKLGVDIVDLIKNDLSI